MLVVTWIRERILLLKSVARLGVLQAGNAEELSYFYFDENGNRMGGFAPHRAGVAIVSPIIPVFCNPKNPAKHRPGFAFLFHGFVVAGSWHLPRKLSQQSDENTVSE